MESARFIGRIGALAVALGLGTAIAHCSVGFALADDGTAGPPSDSAGSAASSATKPRSSAASPARPDRVRHVDSARPDGEPKAEQETGDTTRGPVTHGSATGNARDVGGVTASGSTTTAVPRDATTGSAPSHAVTGEEDDRAAVVVDTKPVVSITGRRANKTKPTRDKTGRPEQSGATSPAPDISVSVAADAGTTAEPPAKPRVESNTLASNSAQVPAATVPPAKGNATATTTFATEPSVPAREHDAEPGVASTVSRLLTSVSAIFGASSAPGSPPSTAPVGWTVLAYSRREAGLEAISATSNQPPALDPVQTGVVVDQGLVYSYGTLNGSDPEGNSLTYSVPSSGAGAPQHGTVYLDGANNFWAHVATQGYSGPDTFTLTVSDGTNQASKAVTVVVPSQASDNAPVVNASSPFVTDPAQSGDYAGTVRGHVNVTDPDGDTLTYSGSGNTAKGYVQVNGATGAYAYVPTTQAAHAASADGAAASGAAQDTFTVVASDGRGGTATIPVTVLITPTNTAPHAAVPPTVDSPYVVTGAVTGSLNMVDDEGDKLSYSVTSGPANGTVTVGSNGSFVYTPTAAARQAAAAAQGATYDGFTVSVTDGHGGATAVAVSNVVVAPQQSTTTPSTPLTPLAIGHVATGTFPIQITLGADGKTLYVVDFDSSTLVRYDASTGTALGDPTGVSTYPVAISLNPTGTAAYVSSSYTGSVDIVDTATGAVTGSIDVGRHPGTVAFSPNGSIAYVLNFTTGELQSYDTTTNALISSVSTEGTRPVRMSLSADGTRAYVLNSSSNTVSVIDTSTMTVVGSPISVGAGNNFGDIALTADGKTAYVTNGDDGTVTVIDTATSATRTIGVGSNPMGVAISPDGKTVYVTNGYSNSLSVIDVATDTVVKTVDLGGGAFAPVSVTVSADGSRVFVGRTSYDGSGTGDVVVLPATALSAAV